MANQNYVNYQIALTPDNAELIDKMNKITMGADYSKPAKSAKPEKKESKPEKKETKPEATGTTADQLKDAAKAAKKDHGEEFAMSVLKDAGVEGEKLGRAIKNVDADDYDEIIAKWQAGPTESKEDDLDDDGLDDDLDSGTDIDPEAVKTALKAYSKEQSREEAKAIMTKNGAKALSNVDDCTQEQLAAMMKVLV